MTLDLVHNISCKRFFAICASCRDSITAQSCLGAIEEEEEDPNHSGDFGSHVAMLLVLVRSLLNWSRFGESHSSVGQSCDAHRLIGLDRHFTTIWHHFWFLVSIIDSLPKRTEKPHTLYAYTYSREYISCNF